MAEFQTYHVGDVIDFPYISSLWTDFLAFSAAYAFFLININSQMNNITCKLMILDIALKLYNFNCNSNKKSFKI